MCKLTLRNNEYPGRLIVFEGTDGAGKTTMIAMTEKYLSKKLGAENVVTVKQPTDMSRKTKLFQKMMYSENHDEIDYRAVQLLTMSDRIQHGTEIIEPALKSGNTVICDRYIFTSLANIENVKGDLVFAVVVREFREIEFSYFILNICTCFFHFGFTSEFFRLSATTKTAQ